MVNHTQLPFDMLEVVKTRFFLYFTGSVTRSAEEESSHGKRSKTVKEKPHFPIPDYVKERMSRPKTKQTRVHMTIAKKLEILDHVRKCATKTEVCQRYNIPPSTLSTIIRQEAKLREELRRGGNPEKLNCRRRGRSSTI